MLNTPTPEISTSTMSPGFSRSGGLRLTPTPPGVLDLLIGIEHELASRIKDEPDRGTKAELAQFGFLALAPFEATAQPVEFRFTHGPLELCYL